MALLLGILVWCACKQATISSLEPSPSLDGNPLDNNGFPFVDWEYWQSVNEDVVGWITVPHTDINYPIVQASRSNPQYYLYHDVFKNWNFYGCPYLDATCTGFEGLNSIVYGHNLGQGNTYMFASFAHYTNASYARDHNTILLQTPQNKYVLKVQCVSIIAGWETVKRTDFYNRADFQTWANERFNEASIQLSSETETPVKLYTFATCSYIFGDDERTLVYAHDPLETPATETPPGQHTQ